MLVVNVCEMTGCNAAIDQLPLLLSSSSTRQLSMSEVKVCELTGFNAASDQLLLLSSSPIRQLPRNCMFSVASITENVNANPRSLKPETTPR